MHSRGNYKGTGMTFMRLIKTPESIQIKEEKFQALVQANLIKEVVDVDSLFNEMIVNALDLEKIIQEYIDLKYAIQKIIESPTKSILEFKILKLLDMSTR